MEYAIINAQSPSLLEINVNHAIKRGWHPIGGMTIRHKNPNTGLDEWYFQAMIYPAPKKTGTDKF